jgi:hypothetical protein
MRRERLTRKLCQPDFRKAGAVADGRLKNYLIKQEAPALYLDRAIESLYEFSMYHVHRDDSPITLDMHYRTVVQMQD